MAGDVVATAQDAATAARPPLIVLDALAAFLDAHGIGAGEVQARPIGDGHSNVTYELRRDGAHVVLRRPPRPPLPPSAHDVLREARLLRALAPAGVRVPRVLALCEDPSVIGMPFFLMDHIDGVVVAERLPPALATGAARARIAAELVDALGELHAIDAGAPDLAALGRPEGYLERQVRRFARMWGDVRTRDVPEVEKVAAWLARNVPASGSPAVVHGDYRLGNVMLGADRPELRAILDWEMATLGDPLADLGYLCATWAQPEDEENPMTRLSKVTRQPGFPSPRELCERYARVSGRNVDGLRFYEVLALFKATVFLESSHRRFLEGRTDDPYFAALDEGVPQLAREAWARATARTA